MIRTWTFLQPDEKGIWRYHPKTPLGLCYGLCAHAHRLWIFAKMPPGYFQDQYGHYGIYSSTLRHVLKNSSDVVIRSCWQTMTPLLLDMLQRYNSENDQVTRVQVDDLQINDQTIEIIFRIQNHEGQELLVAVPYIYNNEG